MEEYLVPAQDAAAEFTERRSRFIGRIWVCETEDEALRHLKDMREKHWDATHNVYAYIIKGGPTRYSDDGEPQGTAGMPVLEVLRREGVYNVCCVVTRYFGGILLGAGGLVRAYARAAKEALNAAGIAEMRLWKKVDLTLPYSMLERIKQELERQDGIAEKIEYGAQISMKLLLPAARYVPFCECVTEISAGKLTPQPICDDFRAFPRKNKENY